MTTTMNLGVDVACRASHRATLAEPDGEFVWSGRRFTTTPDELEQLWARIPDDVRVRVRVVMEPTRNAWVPLAAWFKARGAQIVVVPPEQSADLRDYYSKHTKNDRLDSRILARLPLLHPEGLSALDHLGPADTLKRAVRRRGKLVDRRTGCYQRLDALVELLGPAWADVLGTGSYTKTALKVLEHYADPRKLKRLGAKRLTEFLIRRSRGAWRDDKAHALRDAADQTLELWQAGGLDFEQLAVDIAAEARIAQQMTGQIEQLEDRIETLYWQADPQGLLLTVPGVGLITAATVLGLLGDPNRFANLAGVRSFTGLVPEVDQSGTTVTHGPPTKAGDPLLRRALYLAAERAVRQDPTLAALYWKLVVERGKHHISAICRIAAKLVTRMAACWRNGTPYIIRDVDGTAVDPDTAKDICADDWKVTAEIRRSRRSHRTAQQHKQRTDRRNKESQKRSDTGPSTPQPTDARQPLEVP